MAKPVSTVFDFVHIDKVMEKFGWLMGPGYPMNGVGLISVTIAACSRHLPHKMIIKGKFKNEIISMQGYDENGLLKTFDHCKAIYPKTTLKSLFALKPAFNLKSGAVTASTSSQVADGVPCMIVLACLARKRPRAGTTDSDSFDGSYRCLHAIMGYNVVPATQKGLKARI